MRMKYLELSRRKCMIIVTMHKSQRRDGGDTHCTIFVKQPATLEVDSSHLDAIPHTLGRWAYKISCDFSMKPTWSSAHTILNGPGLSTNQFADMNSPISGREYWICTWFIADNRQIKKRTVMRFAKWLVSQVKPGVVQT